MSSCYKALASRRTLIKLHLYKFVREQIYPILIFLQLMDESERDFAINIFLGRIILEYFTSGKFKKRRISFLAEFHHEF